MRHLVHRALIAIMLAAGAQPGFAQQQDQQPTSDAATDAAASELVVVLTFDARTASAANNLKEQALEAAQDKHVASLEVSDQQVTGQLAFPSIDAYREWTDAMRSDFYSALGTEGEASETLAIRRPALVREYGTGFEGLSGLDVEYTNTGNRAAGDSDIDAVTVMCEAGADCKPSN